MPFPTGAFWVDDDFTNFPVLVGDFCDRSLEGTGNRFPQSNGTPHLFTREEKHGNLGDTLRFIAFLHNFARDRITPGFGKAQMGSQGNRSNKH